MIKGVIFCISCGIFAFSDSTALAQNSPCSAPQYSQFDFWVGDWEVYGAKAPDKKIADSKIEKLYQNCAIRENWMPLNGQYGGSLNIYVPSENIWRQFWVDSYGSSVDFKGGIKDAKMVLEGIWPQPGKPQQITRMTYSKLPDGSVRQFGETSDDNGKTWAFSFDFTYRKEK